MGMQSCIHKLLVSREPLYYMADIPCSTCYPLGKKRTRDQNWGETLMKNCFPFRTTPWRRYAHVRSQPAGARARSSCWRVLVSLIGRLVACSMRIAARIAADRRTDRQTKYCNPRWACTLRVNKLVSLVVHVIARDARLKTEQTDTKTEFRKSTVTLWAMHAEG